MMIWIKKNFPRSGTSPEKPLAFNRERIPNAEQTGRIDQHASPPGLTAVRLLMLNLPSSA
jgi:hypothetical protein